MKTRFHSWVRGSVASLALGWGFLAHGRVHFTVESVLNESNALLTSANKFRGSLSVALDLGEYVRVGGTHRQEHEKETGYGIDPTAMVFYPMEKNSSEISNSLDLTFILYYGTVLMPYVTVGVVRKFYRFRSLIAGDLSQREFFGDPAPNAGVGVGFRIHRDFSWKLSYNVSPGTRLVLPSLEQQVVLDRFSSVGLSYAL